MKILQITAHFYPNIGGVETHLNDLVNVLIRRGWAVTVLTYQPLTTQVKSKLYEKNKGLEIFRIPWFPGLFYKLVSHPLLEFTYLLPGLFLITPFISFFKKPDVIHAHGLVAGFVGVFWGKVFRKKVIISTHSIYNFPKKGLYSKFTAWIFNNAHHCLGLSKQAAEEIKSLGISSDKIDTFTYWVDIDRFKKVTNAKKILGWQNDFVVLFVGRLVAEKGISELLKAARTWNRKINLKIIGIGPDEENIKYQISNIKNIEYLGKIDNDDLPLYYSGIDLLIVPSIHEEGFGRVILESLACETPVLAAKRGAIPEAMDETVGKFIEITPTSIKNEVEYFFNNKNELRRLAKNCRQFAKKKYSEKNVQKIIKAYTS